MFDLKLPVPVEFDLGVLHLPFDLLFGFLFPKPFGGRGGLQQLMVAGDTAAGAVPERFRVVQFVLETRMSVGREFGRFRSGHRARCGGAPLVWTTAAGGPFRG